MQATRTTKDSLFAGERRRKGDRLLKTIRAFARKQQRETQRIFLSLREAARRFGVPLSMIAAVYRQLEREGLLAGVRGSRTVLQAIGSDRQVSVQAIVGMPMSLSSFVTRQKSRMFFM